jgi:hypothetical protein
MSPTLIAIIVIAVLVVAGIALMVMRKREGERLKQSFGPEYDRQVREAGGSEMKAQAELLKREKRVEKLDIRPLPAEQRRAFAEDWQQVQARFVDDPERSIALADALVAEVMKARGYPVEDFEQRAADISVEHPEVVQNYRAAHDIAVRRERGDADTEDLRSALLGYRNLFEELLHSDQPELAH